jgi:hypothetical protein
MRNNLCVIFVLEFAIIEQCYIIFKNNINSCIRMEKICSGMEYIKYKILSIIIIWIYFLKNKLSNTSNRIE